MAFDLPGVLFAPVVLFVSRFVRQSFDMAAVGYASWIHRSLNTPVVGYTGRWIHQSICIVLPSSRYHMVFGERLRSVKWWSGGEGEREKKRLANCNLPEFINHNRK